MRRSTAQREPASQFAALEPVCRRIFAEKISGRVKTRPELENALKPAYDTADAGPGQEVIRTVHELKRLSPATPPNWNVDAEVVAVVLGQAPLPLAAVVLAMSRAGTIPARSAVPAREALTASSTPPGGW